MSNSINELVNCSVDTAKLEFVTCIVGTKMGADTQFYCHVFKCPSKEMVRPRSCHSDAQANRVTRAVANACTLAHQVSHDAELRLTPGRGGSAARPQWPHVRRPHVASGNACALAAWTSVCSSIFFCCTATAIELLAGLSIARTLAWSAHPQLPFLTPQELPMCASPSSAPSRYAFLCPFILLAAA